MGSLPLKAGTPFFAWKSTLSGNNTVKGTWGLSRKVVSWARTTRGWCPRSLPSRKLALAFTKIKALAAGQLPLLSHCTNKYLLADRLNHLGMTSGNTAFPCVVQVHKPAQARAQHVHSAGQHASTFRRIRQSGGLGKAEWRQGCPTEQEASTSL